MLAVFACPAAQWGGQPVQPLRQLRGDGVFQILAALCVYGVVLVRAKREDAPRLAATTASVTAAFSLLSLDAAAGRLLAGPFFRMTDAAGLSVPVYVHRL